MGIDPIMLRKIAAMQGASSVQSSNKTQKSGQAQSSNSGSLMDKLNGLDNQLNQGGGVSINGAQNQKKTKRLWT